jgi:hypothetical protein
MAIDFKPTGSIDVKIAEKEGFFKRFASDFAGDVKETGTNLRNTFTNTTKKMNASFDLSDPNKRSFQGAFQSAGAIAGGVSDALLGDIPVGIAKSLVPQKTEDVVSSTINRAATPIAQSDKLQNVIQKYQSLDDNTKRNIDAVLGFGSLATDIIGGGIIKQGTKQGAQSVLKAGGDALEGTIVGTRRATERLVGETGNLLKPKPDPLTAAGQILQGTPQDAKKFVDNFKVLDIKDVKTYSEFQNRIKSKVGELAQQVDADLAQDTTRKTLNDLNVTVQTKGGTQVRTNYVDTALNHLKEVYEATGDTVKKTEVDELINTATNEGLTKLEINDIARTYGREFGKKAFDKNGNALTSVNARLYENIRSGLKETARSGIGGVEAKRADKIMSTLYDIDNLVDKNVRAVNKLKQRFDERGIGYKIGSKVSQVLDIVSMGGAKGFLQYFVGRGQGLKTLNAVDIENNLKRNLKVIEDALNSKTDDVLINKINKLDIPKSGSANTSAAYAGIAGFEVDEEGKFNFNPTNAAIGMVGIAGFTKAQAVKSIAKKIDNPTAEELSKFITVVKGKAVKTTRDGKLVFSGIDGMSPNQTKQAFEDGLRFVNFNKTTNNKLANTAPGRIANFYEEIIKNR